MLLTQRLNLSCILLLARTAVHTAVSTVNGVTSTPPLSENTLAT